MLGWIATHYLSPTNLQTMINKHIVYIIIYDAYVWASPSISKVFTRLQGPRAYILVKVKFLKQCKEV